VLFPPTPSSTLSTLLKNPYSEKIKHFNISDEIGQLAAD
jgi:hypothetical protein